MKKVIILAALLMVSSVAFAEDVQLRSGIVKKGEIVEKTDQDITLYDATGNSFTIPFNLIVEDQAEILKALPNKAMTVEKNVQPGVAVHAEGPSGAVGKSEDFAQDRYFQNMDGCFLLYNMKTGLFEKVIGEKRCRERFPACSTFKVPLSVMAFDSGILQDENEVLKWDGKMDEREAVNHDHNAKTWIPNSVVWFSQRLTVKLGEERIRKYLHDFHYGNEDMSAGITEAWLVPPDAPGPALKISAYEQVEFMKALWTGTLPVSPRAMQITKDITYLEPSPKGFRLNGKTGSNFYNHDKRSRLGWLVGHITNGSQEYIVVTNFSDLALTDGSTYGGITARAITKEILKDQGLW